MDETFPDPTSQDVQKMIDWLFAKSQGIVDRHEIKYEVWNYAEVVLRYSRMKWGSQSAAMSALAVWMSDVFIDEQGFVFEVHPTSKWGAVLEGIVSAANKLGIDDCS